MAQKRITRAEARKLKAMGFTGITGANSAIEFLGKEAKKIVKELIQNEEATLEFKSDWSFGGSVSAQRFTLDQLKAAYEAGYNAAKRAETTTTSFQKEMRKHYAATTSQRAEVAAMSNEQKGDMIMALWRAGKRIGELDNYVEFLNENYDEELLKEEEEHAKKELTENLNNSGMKLNMDFSSMPF